MSTRILAVQDDAQAADSLGRRLRQAGFTAEFVGPGESVARALGAAPWDVVLIDGGLPGPGGLSLLSRLRRLGLTIPVVLLTARDAVGDRVRGLEDGADDCLSRPFAFEELVARLRALARRGRRRMVLVVSGGVRVDMTTLRAYREGHPLRLRPKELALLLFFLHRPGQVLKRAFIYEQVWGEPYDNESNTLEVHVKELRRELERHGPRLIHARRGLGYLFGPPPEGQALSGEG